MTSPRKIVQTIDLRSTGHDTGRCLPACRSVATYHAAVSGDMAKVGGTTSLSDMGEANITAFGREGVLKP